MSDRIDIIVEDKGISPRAATKIQAIAEAARGAESAIQKMKAQMAAIDFGGVDKLTAAYARTIRAQAQQVSATARATAAANKQAESQAKVALWAQRTATEMAKTNLQLDRVALSTQKVTQAQLRSEIVKKQMVRASARATVASVKESSAIEQASSAIIRQQKVTSDLQMTIDRLTGATDRQMKSARVSAAVFRDAAREQAALEARAKALVASTNPLAAVSDRLNAELRDAEVLYRRGALSATEYATAQSVLRGRLAETTAEQSRLAASMATQEADAVNVSGAARHASQQIGTVGGMSRYAAAQAQNLSYQINDVVVGLYSGQKPMTVFIQQGAQIAQIYGLDKGVGFIFKQIITVIGRMVAAFRVPILTVGAFSAAVANLRSEINKTSKTQVSFGNVFMATFQVAWRAAKEFTTMLADMFAESPVGGGIAIMLGGAVKILAAGMVVFIDTTIGLFVGLSKAIVRVVSDLPNLASAALIAIINKVLKLVSYLIDKAVNLMISGVNAAIGFAKSVGMLKDTNLLPDYKGEAPQLPNPNKNDIKKVADAIAKDFADALDVSYTKELKDKVGVQAILNAMNDAKDKKGKNAVDKTRDAILRLVSETRTPLEQYNRRVAELEALRPFAINDEERDALKRAFLDANIELERALETTSAWGKIFEDVASSIVDQTTNVFRTLMDGSDGMLSRFKDVARSIFDTFKDMLARMATLAIARPILIPMVQSVGNAFGMSAGQIAGVTGQLGGSDGMSMSNAASAAGFLSNLGKSLNTPILSPDGFIGGGINSIGASLGMSGGAWQGVPFKAPNLSDAFTPGAAIAAFGGNMLANFALGDRGIGATIGGTVGGIGGTLASPMITAALLGTPLAPIAPFIGPLLGSFAGNALGGLFGNNKPAASAQTAAVDLMTGRGGYAPQLSFQGDKFNESNKEAAETIAGFTTQISAALGGIADRLEITVGRPGGGAGDAFQAIFGAAGAEGREVISAASVNDLIEAITKNLANKAGTLSADSLRAIQNLDFTVLEDAIADLQFIFAFENLSFIPDQFTQAEAAFRALTRQTAEAAATAARLGLNEQKVYEARDKAMANNRDLFNASVRRQILEIENPQQAMLDDLDATFQQMRRTVFATGGNLVQLEKLYGLQRQQIVEQYAEQQVATLRNAYDDIYRYRMSLRVSNDLSGLSVEERRLEALAQFSSVQQRYSTGEATFADVQTAINNLLGASKDYFSFTEGFYQDQAAANDYLVMIEGQAKKTLTTAEQQLSISSQQLNALNAIRDATLQQMIGAKNLKDDPRLLRPGETMTQLLASFNQLNNLPDLLVRQFKLQAGFDFSTMSGTMSFADFVRNNPQVGQIFNDLVAGVGGKTQNFATGGSFMVGGNGGTDSQLVRFNASPNERVTIETPEQVRRGAANDNRIRAVEEAVLRVERVMIDYGMASAELLGEIRGELEDLNRTTSRSTRRSAVA